MLIEELDCQSITPIQPEPVHARENPSAYLNSHELRTLDRLRLIDPM